MFNEVMEQAVLLLWEKQFPTDFEMRHIVDAIESLGFDYVTHYRYNGNIVIGEDIVFGKMYIENFPDCEQTCIEQCLDIYGNIYRPLF